MHDSTTEFGRDDASFAAAGDLDGSLTDDLRARVKGELEPGERLLWAARSCPPPAPVWPNLFAGGVIAAALLLFAAGCLAISLGRFGPPPGDGSATVLALITSLAGCLVACGTIYSWYKSRMEQLRISDVSYAVTERRIVMWIPEPKTDAVRVLSVPRGRILDLVRVERPDGSGSLELSCSSHAGYHPWYPFGLRHIPEVRRVEQIVRSNLMPADRPQEPDDE